MTPAVTVLGPQRRPTLDRVIATLGVEGPVAAVTAGWQERESDDAELMSLLSGRGVNLRLHDRWIGALDADREYAVAEREHRVVLEQTQQLYRMRLGSAMKSAYDVMQQADQNPRTQASALQDALEVVRLVDTRHVERVRELRTAFDEAWRPSQRHALAGHVDEVASVLAQAACLVVSGGHVGELLWLLELFGIAGRLPQRVVAWSGGAMALTERVVLFHDRAAHGPAESEVMDAGLGLLRGVVLLPHARRRLRTDDSARMSLLARRFAPASCVVLDEGMTLELGSTGMLPGNARVVTDDGRIVTRDAA